MHADERNEEVSARLGRDVYHYHLHVMYIPVVQKEVKWSKRCKDKSLVGTVKEVITQVSHSKKWASQKIMGADGRTYLEKSYSLFQDRFFNYMQECGYDDIQRGEKGSTDQHKTTLQFKADQERKRLEVISHKVNKGTKELNAVVNKKAEIVAVDDVETKTPLLDKGKVLIDKNEFEDLKTLAKKQIASESKESTLKSTIKNIKQENAMLKAKNKEYKTSLHEYTSVVKKLDGSKEKIRLGELEKFYEVVMKFLDRFQLKEQFERFSKGVFKNRSGVDL